MKILIGEDEVLIAEHIKDILISYGYANIVMAHNKEKILQLIEDSIPDIALLDIRLKGKYDGIDIGSFIHQNYNFPIVYITSHSDQDVVQRALETNPDAYIVKPFKPIDIYTAIQLAVSKIEKKNKGALVVKNNAETLRIPYDDILWVSSDNNYVEINTQTRKYIQRKSLSELHDEINSMDFRRIHRSYLVNIKHIDRLFSDRIIVKGNTLPISRKYKVNIQDLYLK